MPTSVLTRPRGDPNMRLRDVLRVHMVGIAGTGMRSMADVLEAAGWSVTGSDLRAASLQRSQRKVADEHLAEAVDSTVRLVVHSDAVPRDNPELRRAGELGIPVLSYPRLLGLMSESRPTVAIAGTHGKSTTTAMAGEILSHAGQDPTVVYGAMPLNQRAKSRLGRGGWLLAEACEYRANFHHLRPRIAVVLGIEHDHVDCFASLDEVESAFARFVQQVPAEGLVLARADCAATRRATRWARCRLATFAVDSAATWQATQLRQRRGYYSFQIRCRGRLACELTLAVPGRHNVQNALAAAAVASHCGATCRSIRAGLRGFAGLERRLERVADDQATPVVDDFAHHPTAVAAALSTVRQMYPARRQWCVFEPHQVSRTARLLDEFAVALHNADKIIVTEIFKARELPGSCAVGASDLVERIARLGGDVVHLAAACQIGDHLQASLKKGDVVVTLGAGDIGAIAHELRKRIRTIRQAA